MVASWRTEEAELLWAQGRRGMAIRLGRALLTRMLAAPPDQAPAPERLSSLQSTLGTWLAANRCAPILYQPLFNLHLHLHVAT